MNQNELAEIIRTEVIIAVGKAVGKRFVPAAVSNRHVHLCRKDIDRLFGEGYMLTPIKPLSQPGQFAAKETVTLHGPKGSISKIRVLGPERPDTQVEISITDSFKLGIKPVIRMSAMLEGTPGGRLEAAGVAELSKGVIVSARHLHISQKQAADLGIKDGQIICLKSSGERAMSFENVLVRSGNGHNLELHIDMDEANAAQIKNGDLLEIIEPNFAPKNIAYNIETNNLDINAKENITAEPLSLVTEDDIKNAATAGFVLCAERAIITPLARDSARELGVKIKMERE